MALIGQAQALTKANSGGIAGAHIVPDQAPSKSARSGPGVASPTSCLGLPNQACPITHLSWINLWKARPAVWAGIVAHAQVLPNPLVSVALA